MEKVECQLRDGEVVLEVHSHGDVDLEEWGAERTAEVFRQIYGRKILLVRGTEEG